MKNSTINPDGELAPRSLIPWSMKVVQKKEKEYFHFTELKRVLLTLNILSS